jgi:hypothetical protein
MPAGAYQRMARVLKPELLKQTAPKTQRRLFEVTNA